MAGSEFAKHWLQNLVGAEKTQLTKRWRAAPRKARGNDDDAQSAAVRHRAPAQICLTLVMCSTGTGEFSAAAARAIARHCLASGKDCVKNVLLSNQQKWWHFNIVSPRNRKSAFWRGKTIWFDQLLLLFFFCQEDKNGNLNQSCEGLWETHFCVCIFRAKLIFCTLWWSRELLRSRSFCLGSRGRNPSSVGPPSGICSRKWPWAAPVELPILCLVATRADLLKPDPTKYLWF